MLAIFYLTFLYSCVLSDDIINSEGDRNSENYERDEYRRFYQDLEGEDWHIAHVKDMLLRRSSCPGETYEDRVAKYRRSLKEDGARVQFVSSEPLPINQTELKQNNTCKANFTDVFIKPDSWKNIKKKLTAEQKKYLNNTEEKSNGTKRRSSGDYAFSHEEYYDEEVEFDPRDCPADVLTIIELQQDHLKPYDVECEMTLEWRSLDDVQLVFPDDNVPASKE